MEKKTYIAPQMEVVELATEVLMFSGSLSDNEANGQLTRGNRDIWDEIW